MKDGLIERIEREAGVSDLLETLSERLAPTDLQSLLLEVFARRAGGESPARLLAQYQANRFVRPSGVDPRRLGEIDRLAWRLLPEGYAPLELAPLCPLGTSSAVATVSQHKVISTVRNTEVVSDPTNVLALECAARRRGLDAVRRREPVLLAASHRVTRAQTFQGPQMWAHFRLLSLCAAGRDEGSFGFELRQLGTQIAFYVRLLQELALLGSPLRQVRVAITDLSDGALAERLEEGLRRPLAERFPEARFHFHPERSAGRGYYEGACFTLSAAEGSGGELVLVDGGCTDWTRTLLSDRKERLVLSGVGVERLCAGWEPAATEGRASSDE